MFNNQESVIQN